MGLYNVWQSRPTTSKYRSMAHQYRQYQHISKEWQSVNDGKQHLADKTRGSNGTCPVSSPCLSLSLCMQTAIDHVENLFLTCHQSDHLCGSKINGPYPLHALVLTSIQEHDWKWWSMGGDECSIVCSMKCSMVTSALCVTTHRNEFG